MKISSDISKEEMSSLKENFYTFFETGYVFEDFLREYLQRIGFEEVQVTQKSKDGGIDLKAIRKGVGDLSELDVSHYCIQAKRYSSKNKIDVKTIRELRGVLRENERGMIITTSDFSKEAVDEAGSDNRKPIALVNGNTLVASCIDNGIGFLYKPVFSKEQMDIFIKKDIQRTDTKEAIQKDGIEKTITSNDIRARIVSVPSAIAEILKETNQQSFKINVNDGEKIYKFNFQSQRKYFGGVTSFLKDYKMLEDGIITPKQCFWKYQDNTIFLYI